MKSVLDERQDKTEGKRPAVTNTSIAGSKLFAKHTHTEHIMIIMCQGTQCSQFRNRESISEHKAAEKNVKIMLVRHLVVLSVQRFQILNTSSSFLRPNKDHCLPLL